MKTCIDCGKPTKKSIRCNSCSQKFNNKSKINPRKGKSQLQQFIDKYGIEIGTEKWKVLQKKQSDNAIKRHSDPNYINPFTNKSVYELLLDKHGKELADEKFLQYKALLSTKSQKNWQNDIYRNKVIKNISKPRHNEFKNEQSVRITQWYIDNPHQKEIRKQQMHQSWVDGKITPHITYYNHSKNEDKLRNELKRMYPTHNITKKTIRINDKWFYPDIIIDDKIIIEFLGDYWHMNPSMYNTHDIHPKIHKSAQEIQEADEYKKQLFEQIGYSVLYLWESEYKNNKCGCMDKIHYMITSI